MAEINFFAKTNFRNQEQTFGIKKDDRRRHMYVIGKTGMGKSNLLENMAIQDIKNGEGLCVVDPHGEFAEKMIKAIPRERINDVVYFNPDDTEFPVAFNILEAVDENKKNLIASGMMGVFKKIWPDVWSPRMEYILNNTILALLDYPGSTMLGVNRMMSDKEFRKRIYPKVKDPVVKSFWINEFDKWEDRFRKEAVAAIQNKVGQFLSSPLIRHIVGQPKSTIDMREIMDNGKILIVNLSKGRIGEDAMRLLGGMIVTKIQLAVMGRVETPEEERRDFYLYVDEFQNFATESFANILSEARKYRLSLILAHQYIHQLIFDGNTSVRDAVLGNVGTLISFRVGAEDAEVLEKEFEPVFMMNDIVNLSKYEIYLKLMIDGIAGNAFSAKTIPPIDLLETLENSSKVVNISRERYGKPRKEIEERIARWSGVFDFDPVPSQEIKNKKEVKLKDKPVSEIVSPIDKKEKIFPGEKVSIDQETKKHFSENEKFETTCYTCGEKIFVPFEPDQKRPTFCKECLKEYQRMKARLKNEKREIIEEKKPEKKEEKEQSGAVFSSGKTLSLSQINYIAPKKFKLQKNKKKINLEEVRKLIDKTKKNSGKV